MQSRLDSGVVKRDESLRAGSGCAPARAVKGAAGGQRAPLMCRSLI